MLFVRMGRHLVMTTNTDEVLSPLEENVRLRELFDASNQNSSVATSIPQGDADHG